MAFTNSQPSKNHNLICPYGDPQTKSGRKTNNFGLRRRNRKIIKLCGQAALANLTKNRNHILKIQQIF